MIGSDSSQLIVNGDPLNLYYFALNKWFGTQSI